MTSHPTIAKRPWKKFPYFEEDTSAEVVIARIGEGANPRLREVMSSAIRHLHEFIKEVRPSHEEWLEAIQFLTKTGTENTILGPLYVENPPHRDNGFNICLDGKGEEMVVRGHVLDTDGKPLVNATVDAWQTNNDGFYDVQQKGVQPDMNLRGIFTTNEKGEFWFRSVKPRWYPIPDDGPVGKLLSAMGRGPERAAHIHFIVKAEGYETAITHVFPPDCPFIEVDAVFGVKETLIGDFKKVDDPERAQELGFTSPFWSLDWDFVLAKEK